MTSKVDLEINQGADYCVFFVIRDSFQQKEQQLLEAFNEFIDAE